MSYIRGDSESYSLCEQSVIFYSLRFLYFQGKVEVRVMRTIRIILIAAILIFKGTLEVEVYVNSPYYFNRCDSYI